MTHLNPSVQQHQAAVGSFNIRYLEKSAAAAGAPVVVLLHDGAWGAAADVTWGRTFSFIPEDLRVIAPDLLGFGGTDKAIFLDRSPYSFRADAVFGLLDVLDIDEPVHLVGNSFGGSVALRALESPGLREKCASVTTISGTGGPWRSEFAVQTLAKFDGTAADMDRIMRSVSEPFEDWDAYLQQRIDWARLPGHFATMAAPHLKGPEALHTQRPDDPYPETLTEVQVPVHIVSGLHDPLVEPEWARLLAEAIGPNARVTELDASHSPNLSAPAETWRVVEDFIREHLR